LSLLVVLGMHRSGTSALTGVFSRLGFAAGKKLLAANEFNARGYFEDQRLNHRLDNLFQAMERSWHDERAMPTDWLVTDIVNDASSDIGALSAEEFDFTQPTVIKDPRICRVLPLMQSVWGAMGVEPSYVFSLRSPFAVMRSLALRDSLPPQRVALLYVAHLLEAEWHTRDKPRVFIEYDELLLDWRAAVAKISAGLALDLLPTNSNDDMWTADIDAFLSADLNHFEAGDVVPTGMAVDLAVEVFSLLRSPFNESSLAALDDLRGRWIAYLVSLEPWLSETAKLNRLRGDLPTSLFKPTHTIAHEANLHAQSDIYWATADQNYAESRKVFVEWRYGQQMLARFVLPAIDGPLTSLRWDISDRPAFCLIERVWLEDLEGALQWEWAPGTTLFARVSPDMHVIGLNASGQLQVMATGIDPHATLCIPDTVLANIQANWRLCATWHAQLPTTELADVMRRFTANQKALLKSEEALMAASREGDVLRSRTAEQHEQLAELEQKYANARDEIVRAEAQLALLKELLLGDGPLETL
jgi:hypothetical protein